MNEEDVKKILEAWEEQEQHCILPFSYEAISQEICQLFADEGFKALEDFLTGKSTRQICQLESKPLQATIIGHKIRPPMELPSEYYNESKPEKTAYKSGMRKVIIWIRSHGLTTRQIDWKSLQSGDEFSEDYIICPEDLQNMVKEWKVNEA